MWEMGTSVARLGRLSVMSTSLLLQVRVLRDYSDVVFSSGKVSLQRGKSHWLPRDEVHPLIMDGVLELVGGAGNS